MSSQEHKQKIWNIIKDIKIGMLTTYDGEDIESRPMQLVQDDYDGTLWFFTKKSSETMVSATESKATALIFSAPSQDAYVTMSGRVSISDDQALIDKFWNPEIAAWFENGKGDPDVALLQVKISHGEHWIADKSKVFQMFDIVKANLTDKAPEDMVEHEKFG